MNKLILCEGKSDAILLSYYLGKTCGWELGCGPSKLKLKADEMKGESAYWYKRGKENLLICGVGGRDNFRNFFQNTLKPMIIDAGAFSKIAAVIDRDERDEKSILEQMSFAFEPVITQTENRKWLENRYKNSYGEDKSIEALLLIIPDDKEGALETLLMDAISENEYDKPIVEKSKVFIEEIKGIASRYINKSRLRLKASLGVIWSVQSPGKVFDFIDNQILSVKWEDSEVLNQCFKELREI